MCGRFSIKTNPRSWFDSLGAIADPNRFADCEPQYNVSPSEPPLPQGSKRKAPPRITFVPAIRCQEGAPIADQLLWPLIPAWAKGEVPKYSTANARYEDMAKRNSYRHAWSSGQRCLLFSTGFMEWQAAGQKSKQPWHIELLNADHMIFGGLWERSYKPDGTAVHSCTIVTMPANPLLREIHNAGRNKHRMPLILLDQEQQRTWLNGTLDEASSVITQCPAEEMHAYRVAPLVNNPNYNDPSVLAPFDAS